MKLTLEEARKRATPGKLDDALVVLIAENGKRLPLSKEKIQQSAPGARRRICQYPKHT